MDECLQSIMTQDYGNMEILINIKEPDPKKEKYPNIVDNANECRERALKTDADYFWMVDDDVLPPPYALTELMKQMGKKKTTMPFRMTVTSPEIPVGTPVKEKHIIGGWWKHHNPCGHEHVYGSWSCGSWIPNQGFANYFGIPYTGLTKVDKIDFGCILISRKVLEKIPFENGDKVDIRWYKPEEKDKKQKSFNGHPCHCLMFAIRAQDLGYELYMCGNVICKHIKRREVCQKK